MSEPILRIEELWVRFTGSAREAVAGVSLEVREGEIAAVVGESGSGKSVISFAVMGLLPDNVHVSAGEIRLGDTNLLALTPAQLRELRGEVAKMLGQFCTDEEITTEGRCEVQVGTQIQIVKLRWKLGPSDHVVREMWDNADRRSHCGDRRHCVARRLAVNRV